MAESASEGGATPSVRELTAQLANLEARLTGLSTEVEDLSAAASIVTAGTSTAGQQGQSDLEVPSPVFDTLEAWVEQYFCVVFARPIGGEVRWCPKWRDHPEAVTRLEALWRAWEALRLDANVGIAAWLTNYLDPQFAVLSSRAGTFSQCAPERHATAAPLPAAV
jgi:hypothetical protein